MFARLLSVLVIAVLLPAAGLAQPAAPSAKEAKVRKLLQLSGAAEMGKQVLDAMIVQFRTMPNLPAGFLDKFQSLAKPAELVEQIIPVYERNLDDQALDAAIEFFMSPGGQKFVKAQPAITKESMELGSQWGRELATRVMKELEQERGKGK